MLTGLVALAAVVCGIFALACAILSEREKAHDEVSWFVASALFGMGSAVLFILLGAMT